MRTELKNHCRQGEILLRTLAAFIFLLVAATAYGQTETGTLIVRVVDQSDRLATEVLVTVLNMDTGQFQREKTNAQGEAVFSSLEPGRYRVTRVGNVDLATLVTTDPQASDSSALTETDVITSGRTIVRIQVPLGVGAFNVAGRAPGFTANAGVSHQITSARQSELLDLPNPNTDITPLLTVVPGAVAVGSSALGRVVIDGKGKEQQTFRLDGLDAAALVELPSGDPALGVLDSLQKQSVTALDQKETSVVSGAFGPLNGPGTGSGTEAVTQRGGSLFKFQVYDLIRNDALDAPNYFDYEGKNAIRRNQFGGKVAGRLSDNGKAFFFLGYEGIRGRTERNVYEAVPVEAATCCAGGPVSPFLGGFLPPGTTLLPTTTSLNPNFLVARRRLRTSSEANAWNLRLDFLPFAVVGDKSTEEQDAKVNDQITFRFTRQAAEVIMPDGVTGRQQRQRIVFANSLLRAKHFTENFIHDFKIGFNETRGMVDVQTIPQTRPELSQALITVGGTVGVTGLPGNPSTVPVATLGGLIRGTTGRGFNLTPYSISAAYNLTHIFGDNPILGRGTHELNAGGEVRFIRFSFNRLGGLTYAFPDVAALRAGTPGSVTFVSDLSEASPFDNPGVGPRRARQEYYMGYFQLRSKYRMGAPATSDAPLVLTYGLRYDYFGAVREQDNRALVVDPQTGDFLPPGTPFYRASKINFEPRFGLAYTLPFKSGPFARTTFRTGAGIYLGVPRISDLVMPIESDRFNTGIIGGTFPIDRSAIARNFIENPETRLFQPLTFARDFTTPERTYKWEASITRGVANFGDFRVAYVGNIGRDLPLAGIANPIVSVATNPDPTRAAIVTRQLDLLRGDQAFGEFTYRTSQGRSSYNALTFSLQRDETKHGTPESRLLRFSSFKLQYTLSRNVGNVTGTVASDPSNFDADYGYNASDARHSLTFSATYKLWEVFKKKRGQVLWGWTLAPLFTARSGLPLIVRLDRPDVVYVDASGSVFASQGIGRTAVINTPGGGSTGGARVPDLIPGADPYLNNGLQLLNPAAFAIPAPGSFGNLGRGELRGPSAFQFDFAVTRHIFEKKDNAISADLKVEFVNLFNRANFSNPSASLPNVLGTNFAANQLQPGMPFTRTTAENFGTMNFGTSTFGTFSAADPGRLIQFSVVVKFNEGF